jgi:hypothetical protein
VCTQYRKGVCKVCRDWVCVCGSSTVVTATMMGTNLFIDRVTLSEHDVAAEQPRKKGIMRSLSLPTVQTPLEHKQRLVNRDEFGEIRRMLFRCAQYDFEPLAPTIFILFYFLILGGRARVWIGWEMDWDVLSSAEQDGHDQRMGKSDLEAVYKAVPCALENGEVVMVSRVVQGGLQCGRHRHLGSRRFCVVEKKSMRGAGAFPRRNCDELYFGTRASRVAGKEITCFRPASKCIEM